MSEKQILTLKCKFPEFLVLNKMSISTGKVNIMQSLCTDLQEASDEIKHILLVLPCNRRRPHYYRRNLNRIDSKTGVKVEATRFSETSVSYHNYYKPSQPRITGLVSSLPWDPEISWLGLDSRKRQRPDQFWSLPSPNPVGTEEFFFGSKAAAAW